MRYLDIVQEHVENARCRYQIELARVGDPDRDTRDFEKAQAEYQALSKLYDELMKDLAGNEKEATQ